jgi:serine/threonine protein phosphatase PrpC
MQPSSVAVSVFARTDIGMQRSGNEDAFLVADLTTGNVGLGPEITTHTIGERGSLLVVSDGMGGAVAGEIASELAVTTIRESLTQMPADMSISQKLKLAVEVANERIWDQARQNPELAGMGATLTAALIHSTVAYIAQVGDSRAYLIRGQRVKQLTKDQSLVQMLLDSAAITPEQASSVPQNVIMQALGTQPTVNVAMSAVQLCQGDYLLLCSDGLSNKVDCEEMREVIRAAGDLPSACRRLVEMANQRGGEDNITVVIARFEGEALQSGSLSITGSFIDISQELTRERSAAATHQLGAPPPEVTTMVAPALSFTPGQIQPSGPAADQLQAEASSAEPPQPEASSPASEKRKKINLSLVFVITVFLLALAAAAYFFYKHYRSKPLEQPPAVEQEPESAK